MLNGLDGAWLPEAAKPALRASFTAQFDALRAEHLP